MTIRMKPPAPKSLIDAKHLRIWLAAAHASDALEYHRGFLVIDRDAHASRLGERERQELDRVADLLLALATVGRGHLLQRRHGDGDYSYLFVFRAPVLQDRRAWLLGLEQPS